MSYGTIRVDAIYPANAGSQPGIHHTAHTLDTDSRERVHGKGSNWERGDSFLLVLDVNQTSQ